MSNLCVQCSSRMSHRFLTLRKDKYRKLLECHSQRLKIEVRFFRSIGAMTISECKLETEDCRSVQKTTYEILQSTISNREPARRVGVRRTNLKSPNSPIPQFAIIPYTSIMIRSGSSINSLMRTRKVTAWRPSTIRWS